MTKENFIHQRVYLNGVSPKTVIWYGCSFRAFKDAMDSKQTIINRIGELKTRGTSHTTINSYLRCINAYFMWQHKEFGKELLRIPKLKEEQKILSTLTPAQVQAFANGRPKQGLNLIRAWTVGMVLLDTGLRISECLGLTKEDVDFENLILKVLGKGGKHRLVPFSYELRKVLWRHIGQSQSPMAFGTKNNTKLSIANLTRDLKVVGKTVGISHIHPHLLRHTFSLLSLGNGMDLFTLSKILGHSSISTTQLYLRSMGIEQIQNSHRQFSPLVRQPFHRQP